MGLDSLEFNYNDAISSYKLLYYIKGFVVQQAARRLGDLNFQKNKISLESEPPLFEVKELTKNSH